MHGVLEYNATPISQSIMNDITTLSSPVMTNNPISTTIVAVLNFGKIVLLLIKLLFLDWLPTAWTGSLFWVWALILLPTKIGLIFGLLLDLKRG